MVDSGRELGISIRGGAEHGLGIYISSVEGGSVGEVHGLKVGGYRYGLKYRMSAVLNCCQVYSVVPRLYSRVKSSSFMSTAEASSARLQFMKNTYRADCNHAH